MSVEVKRNVVALCGVPTSQPGRPSKSLNLAEAAALLDTARGAPLEAYIVVSLLTGARTEELRAHVVARRPRRPDRGGPADSALGISVAVGPGRRRHEDQEVAPHAGAPGAIRRRVASPPREAARVESDQ
ncbi:hypothetical protein GCM10022255_111290 [Dactylosporangium darangshiense]|uniref:Uncharacterized protein n=1 Tax=Dactylosporangium darangshiense TaxID=579108 RepID=A0ABP8DV20_9ACTN